MKILQIETNDLYWAAAAAEVFSTSLTQKRNNDWWFSLKTEDGLVDLLGQYSGHPTENQTPNATVKFPLEGEELEKIKSLFRKRVSLDTEELFGVKLDNTENGPVEIKNIVDTYLLFTYRVYGSAGYRFPGVGVRWTGPKEAVAYIEAEHKEKAEALRNSMCPDSEIVNLSESSPEMQVAAIQQSNIKGLVLPIFHPLMVIARGTYKDWDNIGKSPLVIGVVEKPDLTDEEQSRIINWSAMKVCVSEDTEFCGKLGSAWKVREHYGFDYIRYLKENYNQRGGQP